MDSGEKGGEAAAPLRVLEFYGGIGGMRYALERSTVKNFVVVASFEISEGANRIYEHNFGREGVLFQKSVESVSPTTYDGFCADMFVMSPPCQPYTRQGKRLESADPRAKSLIYMLEVVLPQMNDPPRYILLENVKGFEESDTHSILTRRLQQMQYETREFLLSPLQFGVPNSRLRYYMLAKRKPLSFALHPSIESKSGICTTLELLYNKTSMSPTTKRTLSDYLEKKDPYDPSLARYLVDDNTLWRYMTVADVVQPGSTRTCCITKNYGRFLRGTGSLLQSVTADQDGQPIDVSQIYLSEYLPALSRSKGGETSRCPLLPAGSEVPRPFAKGRIRFLTPREVANLLGFPKAGEGYKLGAHGFDWPSDMRDREIYARLGNSINVDVVSMLLSYLAGTWS